MKIAVIANQAPKSKKVATELREKLVAASFELSLEKPEVVITVGGDGTLLNAFHSYSEELENVRFIGVHTGHLGFYTDWRDYELDYLVKSLKEDEDPNEQVITNISTEDSLSFYNVSFKYVSPYSEKVLQNISLTIPSKKITAISIVNNTEIKATSFCFLCPRFRQAPVL